MLQRMQFRRNMDLIELQGPYLSDAEVQKIVRQVRDGNYQPEPVVSPEDIARQQIGFLLSLSESKLNRRFSYRKLFDEARGLISREQIEELARRLESEGILKKQFGTLPRIINVPARQWQAKYPPCALRPAPGSSAEKTAPPPIDTPPPTLPDPPEPDLPTAITAFIQGLDHEHVTS